MAKCGKACTHWINRIPISRSGNCGKPCDRDADHPSWQVHLCQDCP